MAKLSQSNPEYFKSRDGKIITCIINAGIIVRNELVYKFQAKGVAVQNSNDCYNEELGKRLAESRAKRIMFKQARIFFDEQVKKMKDMLNLYNELTTAASKYKQSQRHEKNHIKFILDNISCE